jgi:hypothetical protein
MTQKLVWHRIMEGDEDEMYRTPGGDDFRADGKVDRRYLLSYDSQAPLWVCSCDDGWFIEVRAVGKAKDWAEEHERHADEPAEPTQLRSRCPASTCT